MPCLIAWNVSGRKLGVSCIRVLQVPLALSLPAVKLKVYSESSA